MRNPILYGDKTFSDCFRSYYQPLCYFASGYVKDSEKAEDVVQDVFVRLLEQPQQFVGEESSDLSALQPPTLPGGFFLPDTGF